MKTSAELRLNLPTLPPNARTAYLLPGLAHNLLALPQLCDNGCTVTFTKKGVTASIDGTTVLRGWRDPTSNLWRVPINDINIKETQQFAANMMYDCANLEQLTHFYHACCFAPVADTWINAINKGYFRGWPNLTAKNVRKYIGNTPATIMGHLQQKKQGLRSTKKQEDEEIIQNENNKKTNLLFIALEDIEGKLYSDQTGKFPRTSSRGMKYIMVFYVYDANAIIGYPLRNKTAAEMLITYKEVYKKLTKCGYKPSLHKLDNELSKEVREFVEDQNTSVQCTPPDIHRQNAAEKAIQTWKMHFKAGLASLPTEFPISHWCKLIPQANYTLNMLRPCRMNTSLSAHEAIEGSFSFDATPFAPPGTKTYIHLKPNRRES